MYSYLYQGCPFGPLLILSDGDAICKVCFAPADAPVKNVPDKLCLDCAEQLQEYFAGRRKSFDLPLKMNGTDFQNKIWKTLLQIPYGSTVTYGDLAILAGYPRAARAAGGALRKNPLWILVPCHRVVGASDLGGYGGPDGTPIKRQLLILEGAVQAQKKA